MSINALDEGPVTPPVPSIAMQVFRPSTLVGGSKFFCRNAVNTLRYGVTLYILAEIGSVCNQLNVDQK